MKKILILGASSDIGLLTTKIFLQSGWHVTAHYSRNYKGLKNFTNAAIISLLVILVHESGHKLMGVYSGYKVKTRIWWYGISIALIICFFE